MVLVTSESQAHHEQGLGPGHCYAFPSPSTTVAHIKYTNMFPEFLLILVVVLQSETNTKQDEK